MKVLTLLFFIYFFLPFNLMKRMYIFALLPPPYAIDFGTVFPYLTIVEVMIALSLVITVCLKRLRVPYPGIIWILYATLNLLSLFAASLIGDFIYFDGILEFVRLSVVFWLYLFAVNEKRNPEALLYYSLLLLILVYVVIYFSGKVNYSEAGRLNAPGFEITSTGYVSGCLLVMSIIGWKRSPWIRIAGITLGFLGLLLAGSLWASICTGIIIIYLIFKAPWGMRFVYLGIVILLLFRGFMVTYKGEKLPLIARISLMGDIRQAPSLTARIEAMKAGINVLKKHPWGFLNSDWYIQENLVAVGYPSHTHNTFIQIYLKYGPLAIIFFIVLIWQTITGLKRGSPYSYILFLLLLGWTLDYALFVTKYALVVFVIAVLNERFLKRPYYYQF